MASCLLNNRGFYLLAGLIVGLVVGSMLQGVWPTVPVHATATHGQENFAIATGLVDNTVEAIYFLDFLTGELKAGILNRQGKFSMVYQRNIAADFGGQAQNAKYLMVTGLVDMPGGGANRQPPASAVYVAEATSGDVAAYMIPWNPSAFAQSRPDQDTLLPLDKQKFRNPNLIRQP